MTNTEAEARCQIPEAKEMISGKGKGKEAGTKWAFTPNVKSLCKRCHPLFSRCHSGPGWGPLLGR